MNTIFAQCSAPGKAGVAVFRISGPESAFALEQLTGAKITDFEPRKMHHKPIKAPNSGEPIDDALVVYFKGQASFTGEDSVEIFVHGSLAVIKLLNKVLMSLKGLRLAEPGEFARRAFLNGKMDLTAAEGLADLIDSETELQHKQAIRQLGGNLEKIYDGWRKDLLGIMSLLEAYIDFPDEDIPEESIRQTEDLIKKLVQEIKEHLDDNNRGERLRSGIKLAILGAPNVGKSSLLNYLLKRDVAIVSDIAGTTRDVIEGHLDISGYPVILQDTAGIRHNTEDQIEKEGIARAKKISENSDIKIIMFDASKLFDTDSYFTNLVDENTIILLNKSDKAAHDFPNKIAGEQPLKVSVKNGVGLDQLMQKITELCEKLARPSELPQVTRARHRVQLEQALEYMSSVRLSDDLVLAAEDIRMTIRALSNITGKITVDEILGEIFSSFCIGK